MTTGQYVLGALIALVTVGSVLVAAALVAQRRLSHLGRTPLVLAFGLLATTGLVTVELVPGALGILSREAAMVTALALAVAATRVARAPTAPPLTPARASMGSRRTHGTGHESAADWALAAAGALVVIAVLLADLRRSLPIVPTSIDALSFHLAIPARWMQIGTLWHADQFTPELAHANYPQNGDLLYLHSLLPFHDLAFVRLTFVPYLLLTGLAVYAIARQLGAQRPPSVLAGTLLVALPAVAQPALDNIQPDAVMLATFGAGLLFGLRHAVTGRRSDLVLAGLGLGLAFGTKWYGVSSVVIVLLVWIAARVLARHRPAAVARDGLRVAALVALAGGFWLVRNLVASGNPLFPVKVAPLGVTLFDAPPDRIRELGGFAIARYLDQPDVLRTYVLPAFERTFGYGEIVLGVAVVVAALLAAPALRARTRRHRRRHGSPHVLVLALLATLLAAAYVFTPYSALGPEGRPVQVDANTRYLVPALLAAAPLAAWAVGRARRWLGLFAQVVLLLVTVDAVRRGFDVDRAGTAAIAVVLIAMAGATFAAARLSRRPPRRWHRLRASRTTLPLGAGVAVLVLLVLIAAGRRQAERLDLSPWRSDAAIAAVLAAPGVHRVGIAGTYSNDGISPVLPAFGRRLDNDVRYVGPTVRHLLREYKRSASFRAALGRERPDLLLVGLGFPTPRATVPELRWARAAGYEPVARSRRLVLLSSPG